MNKSSVSRKYKKEDLLFTTLSEATSDQFKSLVEHVDTLNREEDYEEPISYLGWILQHGLGYSCEQSQMFAEMLLGKNASGITSTDTAGSVLNEWRPAKRPNYYLPPHQIYLAFERANNLQPGQSRLVDIAGFVPDDRDMGKLHRLAEKDPSWIGFFGGHNVHRDRRGQGIGPLMLDHCIEKVQNFVDEEWQKQASVYAFLTNQISSKLLVEKAGFEYVGVWPIEFFNKDEHVFRRTFVPNL